MGLESYEELLNESFINIVSHGWKSPALTADFGAGRGAGAVTAAFGLRRWTLSAELLPDSGDYTIDYEIDEDEFTSPRFTYFYEFIQRHIMLGNKPFIITDSRTRKKYLVAFPKDVAESGVDFEQITSKIFAGGTTLVERRVSDMTFNADGSIDLDYTPPVISALTVSGAAPYRRTRTLTATVTDNIAVTRVDFYIDHQLLASDSVAPFTAQWNTRFYNNGLRKVKAIAFDAQGNTDTATLEVELDNQLFNVVNDGEQVVYEGANVVYYLD
jgi:hypothetical protein